MSITIALIFLIFLSWLLLIHLFLWAWNFVVLLQEKISHDILIVWLIVCYSVSYKNQKIVDIQILCFSIKDMFSGHK